MPIEDQTAKWSLGERIHLAEGLTRIESSLKNQDEQLDRLISTGSLVAERLRSLEGKVNSTRDRVRMHEKVAGGILTAGGVVAGVWAFVREYLL